MPSAMRPSTIRAVNEPVRSYAVGSPERQALKERLASMSAERIEIRSPAYVGTTIRATLVVARGEDAAGVQGAGQKAVSDLLDPSIGPGGEGGAFGRRIEPADVYRALAGIAGLDRIESVSVEGGAVGPDALACGEDDDAQVVVLIGAGA